MRIIKRIGSGGFGNVDLVEDADGNHFAQKTFSLNQPNSFPAELVPNVISRFVREARVQAAISHRNVMPVLEHYLDNDPPSFLMPVADSSLDKDMRENRQLNGAFIRAVMDILAGLEELHANGITHRDLKPQNVLRMGNGDEAVYVISDFGLMSISDTQLTVLTQTGMRMGSDYYTAPEIVADLRLATPASDIYSLGCILHDFVGVNQRIPCHEIKNDGGVFADIIRCCTRNDPTRRFSSISALRDAVSDASRDHIVVAEPKIAEYISAMGEDQPLSYDVWLDIVCKIEDDSQSADIRELLSSVTLEKINELVGEHHLLAIRFANIYAEWIKTSSFSFEFCDTVANRAAALLVVQDHTARVEILIALLTLGTSHNRWYVEKIFWNNCSHLMDEISAKRLALEIRVMGKSVCRMIDHLEWSISVNRNAFHPVISDAIRQVCS